MYVYLCIYNKYTQNTLILCKQNFNLDAINRLTVLETVNIKVMFCGFRPGIGNIPGVPISCRV